MPALASATQPGRIRGKQAWVTAALSFQGLKALGVPQDILASFPPEFQQGMAARAADLGDIGESAPEHWEPPLGTRTSTSPSTRSRPDAARLEAVLRGPATRCGMLPGVAPIWRQDAYVLPNERTSFGFKDGISHPAIEGSGIPGTNPHEAPFKAGEFVLGYPNENGELPPMPAARGARPQRQLRRLPQAAHPRGGVPPVPARARATSPAEEELLAAKFVGRWPSGAPLALAPERDDPELGADPERNNAFLYARTTTPRAQVPARRRTPGGRTRATRPSSAWRGCTA